MPHYFHNAQGAENCLHLGVQTDANIVEKERINLNIYPCLPDLGHLRLSKNVLEGAPGKCPVSGLTYERAQACGNLYKLIQWGCCVGVTVA